MSIFRCFYTCLPCCRKRTSPSPRDSGFGARSNSLSQVAPVERAVVCTPPLAPAGYDPYAPVPVGQAVVCAPPTQSQNGQQQQAVVCAPSTSVLGYDPYQSQPVFFGNKPYPGILVGAAEVSVRFPDPVRHPVGGADVVPTAPPALERIGPYFTRDGQRYYIEVMPVAV